MRYKLARPRDLPSAAELALLETQVEIYRRMRKGRPTYAGPIRNEALAALRELGIAYHFQGRDEQAIEVLEELAADRGKVGAYRYLAVSYERLHRYEEAVGAHRRAIARTELDAFHLGHLGRLLCLLGRDEEALDALEAGQRAAPNDTHIRARLASVRSRLRPDEFDEAARRTTYTIVVVLGDRSNFGVCQALLEHLYRRMHKLVLVVDADDAQRPEAARGLGRVDMKAWLKRHPGIEIADHATIHRRRLAGLSRAAGRSWCRSDRWPWVSVVSRQLRGWTLKMAADLVLVCLDRTDPLFAEPYMQAAEDAGYLICGLSTSERATPLEQRLDAGVPRLRCTTDGVPEPERVLPGGGNTVAVRGDLAIEPAYRPAPGKAELQLFDRIFPTLAGAGFVLYLADPARPALDELLAAGALAGRLRQSSDPALRRLAVVYRSGLSARLPVQFAMPETLVIWPRPDASDDTNTVTMLRTGIHRAAAVVSRVARGLVPAVMADRPAILLDTEADGRAAPHDGYGTGMYRAGTLGEAVRLLGDLAEARDPLRPARQAILRTADLGRRSRFRSLGELLGHGVELLAGGEAVDRVSKLLLAEFDDARGAARPAGSAAAGGREPGESWRQAADRALATAGCGLRVPPGHADSPAVATPEIARALDAAAAIVRGLERCGLIDELTGPGSRGLLAQLLGGIDFPEDQVQAALLLKAVLPELTIYLVDVEYRFAAAEHALRSIFPEARILDATVTPPGAAVRALDFIYTLDKRLTDIRSYVPSIAIAQSALSLVPEERALILANRLAAWPVTHLLLSIASEHPRAARHPRLASALRRSFRLSEAEAEETATDGYLTTLAVSRAAVTRSLTGGPQSQAPAIGRPSVSIGLVVYNGAECLAESLDSILAQTFWDFEVVVVDNGSTDATLEIARSYADRDPRISIYPRRRNVGAVGNFRFALALARGRYFCWASDHDVYDAVWLERMVRALEGRPNAVLAYPYFGMIDDRGRRVGDHLVRFDTCGRGVAQRMRLVTDRMRGSGSKVYGLYRREALDRVRVRTAVWWDRLFLLELAAVGEFVQVDEVLWWRRYKGVLRDDIAAPEVGKFGLIPAGLSTKDTVIRQLRISFEDGKPPLLMRMATLANAVLLVVDVALMPPGRLASGLGLLPVALRSAVRAVVRTKAFIPAEFRALREFLTGGR